MDDYLRRNSHLWLGYLYGMFRLTLRENTKILTMFTQCLPNVYNNFYHNT